MTTQCEAAQTASNKKMGGKKKDKKGRKKERGNEFENEAAIGIQASKQTNEQNRQPGLFRKRKDIHFGAIEVPPPLSRE